MAQKIFKGFKQELEGQFTAETGYLYFVRDEANTGKTDGYILFNGRKYGTSLDAVNYLEGLIGELPSGFSSISEWIESTEEELGTLSGSVETISGVVVSNSDFIANSAATKTELGTLSGRVETLTGQVETISGVVVNNSDFIANSAATKTELGTLSGRVETLTGQVETISGVVVNNSDFIANSAATKDDISTLETNLGTVSGRVDTLEAISADTRLQALEEGVQVVESGDSSVNVSEISNGTQTVSVNISNANYNALGLDETNGGLYVAQILYDGDDSDVE